MVAGKVAAHLCLTLIIKKLKLSAEHSSRVVTTTLNITFCVVFSKCPVNEHVFMDLVSLSSQTQFVTNLEIWPNSACFGN